MGVMRTLIVFRKRYTLLKAFFQDADRLGREILDQVRDQPSSPDHARIYGVFRPVHTLKAICGMIPEAKHLVPMLHAWEEELSRAIQKKTTTIQPALSEIRARMDQLAETLQSITEKLELWQSLGSEECDELGLWCKTVEWGRVWIPIVAIESMEDQADGKRIWVERHGIKKSLQVTGIEGVSAIEPSHNQLHLFVLLDQKSEPAAA